MRPILAILSLLILCAAFTNANAGTCKGGKCQTTAAKTCQADCKCQSGSECTCGANCPHCHAGDAYDGNDRSRFMSRGPVRRAVGAPFRFLGRLFGWGCN